jgi:hypothetical protein
MMHRIVGLHEVMNGCYFWRTAFCAFLLKGTRLESAWGAWDRASR